MSRACYVVDGDDRWPGTVLAWWRTPAGWRGLVRYRAPHPSGHVLNFERALPAAVIEPRP